MTTATMNSAMPLICLAPLLPVMAQAALPHDVDQAFSHYNELADRLIPILESAKDKESAEAAASELNALLPKVYDVRTELQKLKLAPEEQEEARQKYGHAMQVRWGKAYEHIFRLQKSRCYDSLAFFKQFHTLCAMLDQ